MPAAIRSGPTTGTTAPERPTGARPPRRTSLLVRCRRLVVLLALGLTAAAGCAGHTIVDRVSSGGVLPAQAESARAEKILARDFAAARPDFLLLAHADRQVTAPAAAAAGRLLTRRLAADPEVVRIQSYWTAKDPALRSYDQHSALILLWLRGDEHETEQAAERLMPTVTGRTGPLRVAVGGDAAIRAEIGRQAARDMHVSELIALPVTVTLLLLVFGSLVAAVLPVAVGVFAVLGTTAVLRALTEFTEVTVYALNISTALAFGLAIDYSLFLISRYREERDTRRGDAPHAAHRPARGPAHLGPGHRLLGGHRGLRPGLPAGLPPPGPALDRLRRHGRDLHGGGGQPGAAARPAGPVGGDRLERGDIFARWRRRRRPLLPAQAGAVKGLGLWGRIAVAVMRSPLSVGLQVACVLLVLAAPFAHARFGLFDDRVLPADAPLGRVEAALRDDFRGGTSDPTIVVLPDFDAAAHRSALDRYAGRISHVAGVTQVDTAGGSYRRGLRIRPDKPDGRPAARFTSARGAYLSVSTRGEPSDAENAERVRRIRALPAPAPALVGGLGANLADAQGPITDRLPLALALVAASMFVLVLALTRRPTLALKAMLLNSLSLCATFGALVYIFQEGHLRWLVGDFTVTGTTDVLLPMVVLCVAFGLSMDYECILLSRIVEEYQRSHDTTTAVARGLDRTAHLFTCAALILAVVMAALAGSGLVFLKAVGIGLALAALLDATVVRGLLVPAVMRLAGPANWWAPACLLAPAAATTRRGRARRVKDETLEK
ncbi:MMPL family transporter [Streptomyces olivoverticillatus]